MISAAIRNIPCALKADTDWTLITVAKNAFKVNYNLEHPTKAQRGNRYIALLIL